MSKWIDALAVDDVPQGDVVGAIVLGRDVAFYGVGATVYATDNLCSHGRARLCEGFLDDYEIECPLHQGRFDVRSGLPTCSPAAEKIRSYPVKIENGRVYIELD